jgi:transposase
MQIPDPTVTPTISVDEAARILGISRGAAYAMARSYRESDGAEGLPTVICGPRRYRVPTAALRRMLQLDAAG